MAKKMYQCCYTNHTQEVGGKIQSGWQTVAVSQDIPGDAYKKCERLQRVNSTIPGSMVDENGEVLNLLEISGDDKFVYVMRTQYGLQDRLGRRNMFSHAYVLWWKDVILDPNSFLQIVDKANFKADENAALQLLEEQNWEVCQPCSYTIEQALETAGLNRKAESYPGLIGCIYAKMSDRRLNNPLYIQCDSEEQMRALLFCIYYGLPHYLRKKLHVASAAGNSTENKHIIFSKAADRQPYRFDPKSGDNTILVGRLSRKLMRYGFIDYVARNTTDEDYFVRLAEEAANLGDLSASNELILKIAHKRMTVPDIAQYSGSEVNELLSDALRSNTFGSTAMCGYIAQLLDRAREEKHSLMDETQSRLAVWETASALSEALLQELKQMEDEFTLEEEKKRAEVKSRLEEKYDKLLERCREELREEERANLGRRLKLMEENVWSEAKRRIEDECQKRKAELTKEHEWRISTGRFNLIKMLFDKYQPGIDEAEKRGQKENADALKEKRTVEINTNYNQIIQTSQTRMDGDWAQDHKKIEERVGQEYKCFETQKRVCMEKESEQLLEDRVKRKKEELDQQKQTELELEYEKLGKELENGKSARLKELESKANLARALKEFKVSYIQALSQDEVLQMLEKLQEDKLSQYVSTLLEVEDGKKIIFTYCDSILQKRPLSWETLHRVLTVSGPEESRTDRLNKELDGLAWELYCQSLNWVDGVIYSDFDQYQDFLNKFVSPELAEAKLQKARQRFWEEMSFERFSMDNFPEYFKMAEETGRSRMFSEFYAIINDLPTATEEEFLNRVQTLFSRFHGEIGPDEQEIALALLEKTVNEQYHGSDPFLTEWVYVFMMADSEQMFNKILAVRSALYECRYNDLILGYDQVAKSKLKRINDLKKAICDIIFEDCDRRDSGENPVPLDVWLLAAGDKVNNSFDIFNVKSPAILQCSSLEVVRSSELLQIEKYANAAESYIQRRGKEHKIVKKWVNELKLLNKSGGNKKVQSSRKKVGGRKALIRTAAAFEDEQND